MLCEKNLENPQLGTRNRTSSSKAFSSIILFRQKWKKYSSYCHKRLRGISLLSKNGKDFITTHFLQCDLMNIIISASDVAKQASRKQFSATLAEIWNDQHRLPEQERLSIGMLRLIDQRQTKNITDCLQ